MRRLSETSTLPGIKSPWVITSGEILGSGEDVAISPGGAEIGDVAGHLFETGDRRLEDLKALVERQRSRHVPSRPGMLLTRQSYPASVRDPSSVRRAASSRGVSVAEVLLFHHAQGQTPGFLEFADTLRRAGHAVHTPDLFDGRTFPTVDEGVTYARGVGFGAIIERGVQSADDLPAALVYAGFSLGVMPAQKLAQTRPGAAGALLFEACAPTSEFGAGWPAGVPVQIHGMDADPFFAGEGDIDAARQLVEEAASTAMAELFVYPGDRHLFADGSLSSYDPDATALLTERVLAFLGSLT